MPIKIVDGHKVAYGNYYDELKSRCEEELTLAEVVFMLRHELKKLEKRVHELEQNPSLVFYDKE